MRLLNSFIPRLNRYAVIAALIFCQLCLQNAQAGKGGGDGGGGGNLAPSTPATAADIHASILGAKTAFLAYLYGFRERHTHYPPIAADVSAEQRLRSLVLDPKRESPEQTLRDAIVTPSQSPCYYKGDPKPKDASADEKTHTICFSIPRLLDRKYSTGDIDRKILSLFGHEFLHLRGLTHSPVDEDFAELLQKDTFDPEFSSVHFEDVNDAIMSAKSSSRGMDQALKNNIAELQNDTDFNDFCLNAVTDFENNDFLNNLDSIEIQKMNMAISSAETEAKFAASFMVIVSAIKGCAKDNSAFTKKYYRYFTGRTKVTLLDVLLMFNPKENFRDWQKEDVLVDIDTTVPNIAYGDREGMLREFSRGLQLFEEAADVLMATETPGQCTLTGGGGWGCITRSYTEPKP